MVYQHEALNMSCTTVAANLCVDQSTVSIIVSLFRRTGNVSKKQYDATNLARKLTDTVQLVLIQVILDYPGIKLHEIQHEIEYLTGSYLEISTICQFLHKNGFSRQKMRQVALQRSESLRASFASELSVYQADMFVFIDETGADRRAAMRRYAYSFRGKPATAHRWLVRGERLSTIAMMSTAGVLDCKVVTGSVNGDVFYDFVQGCLLPHLMPFNGINPHSVVVLDKCSIHHVAGIMSMVEDVGALVMFLPPYSPDYNPIEELFSKVKNTIKQYETDLEMQEMDLEEIVLAAFSSITEDDCYSWIEHAMIYPMN